MRTILASSLGLLASLAVAQQTQTLKLVPADAAAGDTFGAAIALEADTLVVGAPLDDVQGVANCGSVAIYTLSAGTWTLQAKLAAADKSSGDAFGSALALDGDTLAVGARLKDSGAASDAGAVYVYLRSGATWSLQSKLAATLPSGAEQLGTSVALDGDTLIAGAPLRANGTHSFAGGAYVWKRTGANWALQTVLGAADAGDSDLYGISVALLGERALVGAWLDDHSNLDSPGAAYLHLRTGSSWTQEAKLTAADAAGGDHFGWSVALAPGFAFVGAREDDQPNAWDCGSVYVFQQQGATWVQSQKLQPIDLPNQARFGNSLAASGSELLVGEPGRELEKGAALLYTLSGGTWSAASLLLASDADWTDALGSAVALTGNRFAAGAPQADPSALGNAGALYLYEGLLTPLAQAVPRAPCGAPAPPQSLLAGASLPVLGGSFVCALDDPSASCGLLPGATLGSLALSTAPAAGYPCGIALPGLGAVGGLGDELLLSLAPGSAFPLLPAQPWSGPGAALQFNLAIPGDAQLAGLAIFAQGLLVGPIQGNTSIVLSSGLDLVLGY